MKSLQDDPAQKMKSSLPLKILPSVFQKQNSTSMYLLTSKLSAKLCQERKINSSAKLINDIETIFHLIERRIQAKMVCDKFVPVQTQLWNPFVDVCPIVYMFSDCIFTA